MELTTKDRLQQVQSTLDKAFKESVEILKGDKDLKTDAMRLEVFFVKVNQYVEMLFGLHGVKPNPIVAPVAKETIVVQPVPEIEKSIPTEEDVAKFKQDVDNLVNELRLLKDKKGGERLLDKYEEVVFDGVVKVLGLNIEAPYNFFKMMDIRDFLNSPKK